MESPQTEVMPAKKNQTPLIVAASAVVLCCCCAALAIAGYYGYNTLRVSESDTVPFDQTAPEFDELVTEPANDFDIPDPDLGIGDAPTGGLGNDILRNDTWAYIAFASMGQGCDQPLGEETTIEVLQEPQGGVWVEKWTVACASGASYAYEVEYILDDSGATFNIKSLP
jgi:hypothetical protein